MKCKLCTAEAIEGQELCNACLEDYTGITYSYECIVDETAEIPEEAWNKLLYKPPRYDEIYFKGLDWLDSL